MARDTPDGHSRVDRFMTQVAALHAPHDAPRVSAWAAARRAHRWLLIVAASVLVHLALLSELRWTWSDRPLPLGGGSVRVRIVEDVAPRPDAAAGELTAEPALASTIAAIPAARATAPPRGARNGHDSHRSPQPVSREPIGDLHGASAAVVEPLPAKPTPPNAGVAAALPTFAQTLPEERASAIGGETVPIYATVFSEAASARYRVTRGTRAGEGLLAWRPSQGAYRLTFDAPDVGWTQSSEGAFDAAGLAPRRYLERTSRSARSTNFDAEAGVVRFSASNARQAWLPGSQDRLGWIVQLGAVIAAEPGLAITGARIVLPVAGVRGEAMRWDFVVRGVEPLETPAGAVATVHLAREPASSKDIGIDVWLDPALPALPVRVEWRTPLNGTVLVWERLDFLP